MSKRPAKSSKTPATDASARQNALRALSSAPPRAPLEIMPRRVSPASRNRKELKGVAIWLHPTVKAALTELSKRERKTIQQLGEEAFDGLFLKYRLKKIDVRTRIRAVARST